MKTLPLETLFSSIGIWMAAPTMWALSLAQTVGRVYTVEGNSGDACKIRSYDLNYEVYQGLWPDELVIEIFKKE